ncbi:hypothetical protein C2E20_3598 [Micractinium conductrix]|uniref:Uncharacterized protein n=1 Tax=Micractinium conductrix TaxID=554055 RepID=A0A2P6VG37_9CHLO|nr:hypothetical protein C2E20_3598 [Micractinium conductrix]|eukprot:PSC73055.1 hypothetical protein C2E20_3598 [Micractinium conductrix]
MHAWLAFLIDAQAVFARLLSGNDQRALKLLPGSAVTAPGGLTTLHAAVAGLCGAAVLAAAVAAGAPLEARLEQSQFGGDLYRFLGQIGCPKKVQAWLFEDDTALGIAMRAGNAAAVAELLRLGGDCFAPPGGGAGGALAYAFIDSFYARPVTAGVRAAFLARLEQRRAAGALHLRDVGAALELLRAAVVGGHVPLAAHSVTALDGHVSAEHAEHAALLWELLTAAASSGSSSAAGMLRVLLHGHLRFDLTKEGHGRSLLGLAASGATPTATVPVLHAAGAHLDLEVLLRAVQSLSADGVAAQLACEQPAVDARSAVAALGHQWTYTCPIHCMLHTLAIMRPAPTQQQHVAALRTLGVLLAAGYRPTVWRDVPLPAIWPFPLFQYHNPVSYLDPFDHYPAGALSERLLFVARGGTWSPATHRLWPPAFKAATRTLLLAGARSSGSGRSGCPLAALPGDELLRVVELAAAPMSAWVGADGSGW